MKRKNENVPGFDEIIFENRNKEYGAYDLRKRYLTTTFFSLLGGAAIIVTLVLLISFLMPRDLTGGPVEKKMVIVIVDPTLLQPEPPKPEPAVPKPLTYKPIYVEPEIVEKLDSNDRQLTPINLLDTAIGNKPINLIPLTTNISPPEIPVEPTIPVWVQEMPTFPGGNEALFKFIYKEIKYPEPAVQNGVQGRVTLRFVVSPDGSIRRVEILRGVDPLLDAEAIRVISSLPKWNPGKQNGDPVSVWFTVPVTFKLENR
jgi:protein TonB